MHHPMACNRSTCKKELSLMPYGLGRICFINWKGSNKYLLPYSYFSTFFDQLLRWNYNACVVDLLDFQFMSDITKYLGDCMASLFAMAHLFLEAILIVQHTGMNPFSLTRNMS